MTKCYRYWLRQNWKKNRSHTTKHELRVVSPCVNFATQKTTTQFMGKLRLNETLWLRHIATCNKQPKHISSFSEVIDWQNSETKFQWSSPHPFHARFQWDYIKERKLQYNKKKEERKKLFRVLNYTFLWCVMLECGEKLVFFSKEIGKVSFFVRKVASLIKKYNCCAHIIQSARSPLASIDESVLFYCKFGCIVQWAFPSATASWS